MSVVLARTTISSSGSPCALNFVSSAATSFSSSLLNALMSACTLRAVSFARLTSAASLRALLALRAAVPNRPAEVLESRLRPRTAPSIAVPKDTAVSSFFWGRLLLLNLDGPVAHASGDSRACSSSTHNACELSQSRGRVVRSPCPAGEHESRPRFHQP